jgi:hypothetical protein
MEMSQRAAGDVGEHLLHDGVVAVLPSAWTVSNGESVKTA